MTRLLEHPSAEQARCAGGHFGQPTPCPVCANKVVGVGTKVNRVALAREHAQLMAREISEEEAARVRELMGSRKERQGTRGYQRGKRDVDEEVVYRAIHGQLHGLKPNIAERREAFETLSRIRPDLSAQQMADRLNCDRRTIDRYRAKKKRQA